MLQGNHDPCEFNDKEFICLIKIREKGKKKKIHIYMQCGFSFQDPEGVCTTKQLHYLEQVP